MSYMIFDYQEGDDKVVESFRETAISKVKVVQSPDKLLLVEVVVDGETYKYRGEKAKLFIDRFNLSLVLNERGSN
jgi:hypothetical protein